MKNKILFIEDHIMSLYEHLEIKPENHDLFGKRYRQLNSIDGIYIPCTFDVCEFNNLGNVLNFKLKKYINRNESVIYACDSDDYERIKLFSSHEDAIKYYLHLPSIIEKDWINSEFTYWQNG